MEPETPPHFLTESGVFLEDETGVGLVAVTRESKIPSLDARLFFFLAAGVLVVSAVS